MKAEQPTTLDAVYRLAGNPEWENLLKYLGMLESFGLILLLAPEQAGVDVCRRALRQHFAASDRALWHLRLHPGERPGALGDHLLNDPLPENAAAVWVDAAAETRAIADAPLRELWRLALGALNPRRNPVRRRIAIPLIFAGPVWLQEVFRQAAPDVWSVRDTIIRIEPPTQEHLGAADLGIRLDSSGGQPEGEPGDPEETRQALERLAHKEVPPAQRAEFEALRVRLLQRLGNQLRRDYRWEEAEAALREAESVMEENPGSIDDQGSLLFDLSLFYGARGAPERAEYYARKCYEFTNSHFGPEDRNTLTSRNNLAAALRDQGKHDGAEQEHRALLALRERVLGPEHPDTLMSRNNLATMLADQGRSADSEREHRAVLALRERVLGPEQPDTLTSRNNLANALRDQGKHDEAEQEHRAVLALRERVLGPEHPDTIQSRNNLANVLDDQGKHAEAERQHRAVLDLSERVLGARHLQVFRSCYNLARALANQGKLTEALPFAQRAREGRQAVLGAEHPSSKAAEALCEEIEADLAAQRKGKGKR